MFYDVHCHLDLIKNEKELRTTIKEALTAGVEQMISCSTTFASNQHNLNLQKSFPNVKAGIGLYPLDAMELNEEELKRAFGFFKTHAKEAIAIGEVGLDYKFAKSEEQRKKQEEVFRQFIMLSNETKKPLIIHSRFAQSQVIEILVQEKAQKVLLHSFVDSEKLMKKVTEQGFFISVGLSILSNEQTQKNITLRLCQIPKNS